MSSYLHIFKSAKSKIKMTASSSSLAEIRKYMKEELEKEVLLKKNIVADKMLVL